MFYLQKKFSDPLKISLVTLFQEFANDFPKKAFFEKHKLDFLKIVFRQGEISCP